MTLQQLMVRLIDQQEGGYPARMDALMDLLVVCRDLAGDMSNVAHATSHEYEQSARTSQSSMEDKKWAKQYAKDAETYCQLSHDLSKLRNKYAKKLSL